MGQVRVEVPLGSARSRRAEPAQGSTRIDVSEHLSKSREGLARRHRHGQSACNKWTLTAQSGATVKEAMRRLGHSTIDAAMIYQHATDERDRAMDARSVVDIGDAATDPSSQGRRSAV